jgi:hypothetical protein
MRNKKRNCKTRRIRGGVENALARWYRDSISNNASTNNKGTTTNPNKSYMQPNKLSNERIDFFNNEDKFSGQNNFINQLPRPTKSYMKPKHLVEQDYPVEQVSPVESVSQVETYTPSNNRNLDTQNAFPEYNSNAPQSLFERGKNFIRSIPHQSWLNPKTTEHLRDVENNRIFYGGQRTRRRKHRRRTCKRGGCRTRK